MSELQGVKIFQRPKLKAPLLLAGWPGMGAVATQAVDYIRRSLNATMFAEIDTRDFNVPYAVTVYEGIGNFPEVPRVLLFYNEELDLIICEGEEQFSGKSALRITMRLFRLAKEFSVSRVFTGAAFVQHMNHRDKSSVHCVTNSAPLRDWLVHEKGMNILRRGQISGLNGSILGFAAQENIEAACFLATIPIYAVNLPNPKAAKAIIEVWQRVIGFELDFTALDTLIHDNDRTLEVVEEQLKKLSLGGAAHEEREEAPPAPNEAAEKVSDSVRERIEALFESAKKDKRIAHRLKEELDRYHLFKEYEDRFLDLFSDSQ